MKNTIWRTCFPLFCFLFTVFGGNYTYYDGFAYINANQTISTFSVANQTVANQTINYCICQCLFTNGCSALNFYNATSTCLLISDPTISEDDVSMNSTARLLLVSASLSPSP